MPLSTDQKRLEIEKAVIASAWRRPDSIVTDLPHWFEVQTPSSKFFALNRVARSILSDEVAPGQVASTVAKYRASGQSFTWILGPTARPGHLSSQLENHGLKLQHSASGMVTELSEIRISAAPRVTVERVTLATVPEYVKASLSGWNSPPEVGPGIQEDMIRALQDPLHDRIYYLARHGGVAAGSGALLPLHESGYLLGSSVAPEFRGKGVYRSLVAARLEVLRSMGVPLATIQAMTTTSAPICARLGFETVSESRSYFYHP